MQRIAVIGAGVSGLTVARQLAPVASVTVYEGDSRPGGLIKCDRVEGSLFHRCGGHVFNTRLPEVSDLFWSLFDRDREFVKADRNSAVSLPGGLEVPYPIENHAYMLPDDTLRAVIADVASMHKHEAEPADFEDFLRRRFGATLYGLYFGPYNRKIWGSDLSTVPLSWLEGKLPMPTPEEIIYNNIRRVKEKAFVHSTFYYEREGGSQYLADRLASGVDVRYGRPVESLRPQAGGGWSVDGDVYDRVVYTGNLRALPALLPPGYGAVEPYLRGIEALKSHGTTTVFCDVDPNPYSWIYLPDGRYDAHRIICTGNFAPSNNAPGRMTATVEFTGEVSRSDIERQLPLMPYRPRYLAHAVHPCTYPVQDAGTRIMVAALRSALAGRGLYLTGRFAQWEYFNMDVSMASAMDTAAGIKAI